MKLFFRVATSPERLGWTPAAFWSATAAEFVMAVDGMKGQFQPGPWISRERVAEIARAWGKRKSIKG